MITVKTPEEIKILSEGGKILASILLKVAEKAKAGLATIELNEHAERLIKQAGGEPSFKNYKTKDDKIVFPASLCVSINDEVVHGIPSSERFLREGDVVSLDLGMKWRDLYTDRAITVGVGAISNDCRNLLDITRKALDEGTAAAKEGAFMGDIGFAIQNYVEANGFNVVKSLVGHGVGHFVHEDPEVPNWGKKNAGVVLKSGMVLALEPMVSRGKGEVFLDKNKWTWKTKNKSTAAHFEHTIAITRDGAKILTLA